MFEILYFLTQFLECDFLLFYLLGCFDMGSHSNAALLLRASASTAPAHDAVEEVLKIIVIIGCGGKCGVLKIHCFC